MTCKPRRFVVFYTKVTDMKINENEQKTNSINKKIKKSLKLQIEISEKDRFLRLGCPSPCSVSLF